MNKTLARWTAAASTMLLSTAVMAQSGVGASMDDLGGGFIDAVCAFIDSPIVTGIAAVCLLVLMVLWMMDEARGFMATLLKIAFGVAVILNIGTVTSLIGLNPIC